MLAFSFTIPIVFWILSLSARIRNIEKREDVLIEMIRKLEELLK